MMLSREFKASLAMIALLLTTPLPALAQAQGQGAQEHHPENAPGSATAPAPGGGMMQEMPQAGMPENRMMPMMGGSGTQMGMMDCPMMTQMMRMHPEMVSQMMRMHPEMMAMMHGQGKSGGMMMGRGSGSGMMMGQGSGSGMMMRPGGMALDLEIVRPIEHLSADDVRHYFEHRLRQIGNDRLKLGEVAEAGDELITVDIVTADDSLVDRLEVDRHSGRIERAQ